MAPRGTLLKGTNTKIHARPVTPNELSAASDFSFFSYVLFLQGKSAKRKSVGHSSASAFDKVAGISLGPGNDLPMSLATYLPLSSAEANFTIP